MAVKRQLISRATSCRLDEPEFQMRRWKIDLEDYNIFLDFAKGRQGDNGWDWSNTIRVQLQDADIDSFVTMGREFIKAIRRTAYTQQQSQAEPKVVLSNPFIVTRNNEFLLSLWCNICVETDQNGSRKAYRETEIRVYKFDGNWDSLTPLYQDTRNNQRKEYTGYEPIYVFKLSNSSRIRGLFVYEDAEQLEVMLKALETCILKDSAVFVDHFRKVSEENGNRNQATPQNNVGYNNKIPASGEPAMPNVIENDFPF